MKTKINFTIESKEITKQIEKLTTAEAKNLARSQFLKAYNDELERITEKKITDLVKNDKQFFDKIKDCILEELNKQTNIKDLVRNAIDEFVKLRCGVILSYIDDTERKINNKIKTTAQEEIKNLLASTIIEKIFSSNDPKK